MTEDTSQVQKQDDLDSWRDGWEPLPMRATIESFTGFDEVAIHQMFRKEWTELPSTMTARAALFVLLRRKGLEDAKAFRVVMRLTLGEFEGLFIKDEQPEDAGSPEA